MRRERGSRKLHVNESIAIKFRQGMISFDDSWGSWEKLLSTWGQAHTDTGKLPWQGHPCSDTWLTPAKPSEQCLPSNTLKVQLCLRSFFPLVQTEVWAVRSFFVSAAACKVMNCSTPQGFSSHFPVVSLTGYHVYPVPIYKEFHHHPP